MRKFYIIIAMIFALTNTWANTNNELQKDHIDIDGIRVIDISTDSGDIEIIPEERSDIYLELTTYRKGPDLIIREGKTTVIDVKQPFFTLFNIGKRQVKLKVFIPYTYNKELIVNSASGDLDISDLSLLKLKTHLSSGDLNGTRLEVNKADISSSSGDITMDLIKIDNLDIRLSSGSLILDNFIGQIDGHSSSGDVDIMLERLTGNIDFRLSSGDFYLDTNETNPNVTLDLSTSSGSIDVDFPVTISQSKNRKTFDGHSGSGKYQINLNLSSGNIIIK
ncbi:MAG: DUF4097 domain-containing protein [Spirochaetaceae bacterium]